MRDRVKQKQKHLMSKLNKNSNFSGTLGSEVSVRQVGGRLVIANRPKPRPAPSDKQLAVQERIKDAARYARRQILVETSKALYESGITDRLRSAFAVAL